MNKIKSIIKTIFIVICCIGLNILSFRNIVKAVDINTVNIMSVADCGELLKYKGIIVKTYYAEYNYQGNKYPAYCLDKTKSGVSDINPSYNLTVEEAIKDVKLWRIIINGYPYKTIEELGVANKEEAFTATKQAVYTYIHNNQLSDYEAIGEAGERTLNALYKIVNDANNSTQTQISNNIGIKSNEKYWQQDNKQKEYVYKSYKINADTSIKKYKVKVVDEFGNIFEEAKIVDKNNIEKSEFEGQEDFKILIPIKSMTEEKSFNIKIETQVETKPILYGRADNTNLQDYALTAATYEEGNGSFKDKYTKNETKLIVIKQDKETQEKLEGVEFNLLNEKQEVIYANLKTDKNGTFKIENLLPGIYYLKETKPLSEYQEYGKLIKIELDLNEEMTVTMNNSKNKEEEVKILVNNKEVTNEGIIVNTEEAVSEELVINSKEVNNKKILPVTGM